MLPRTMLQEQVGENMKILKLLSVIISMSFLLISCGKSTNGIEDSDLLGKSLTNLEGFDSSGSCTINKSQTLVCLDGTQLDLSKYIYETVIKINQEANCDIVESKLICSNGFTLNLEIFTENLSCTVDNGVLSCPDGSSMDIPSCSATKEDDVATVMCTDGTKIEIHDGKDGQDGKDGKDGKDAELGPYAIVDIIDPCGDQHKYDEILLVLNNGDILAHYSDDEKQHFALVGDGKYMTTDGTKCVFTIKDGKVTW